MKMKLVCECLVGPVLGSRGWPSSGWVQWFGRVLAVVKASGDEFAAPAKGGSFSTLSLLLSVYLPFTIFSMYSLSCSFIG